MSISFSRPRGQTPLVVACTILVFAFILAGCGSGESPEEDARSPVELGGVPDSMTIDRVLRTDRRFSILVRALDSTGLDSVLATGGPYTLFAPPDTAFAALPEGTVPVLFAERRARLRAILAHHVVEGRVPLRTGADSSRLPTLGGDTLRVRWGDSARVAGTARILDGDVEAANGLIHVIDAVLRPPAPDDGQPGAVTSPEGP